MNRKRFHLVSNTICYNRSPMKRLYSSLSAPLQQLLNVIEHYAPAPIYLVGGIVRDLLLAHATEDHDLDLITEADAPSVVAALVAQLGGSQTTHSRFATATWHLPSGLVSSITHIDFATTRTETYPSPAQLPVVTASTIEYDLARRDFTINAMALPLGSDTLIDPHGGQADLASGTLRLLSPISLRQDPTRLLRAVRFEQRFGFTFASNLVEQTADALHHLPNVTGPRIWNELEKISAESNSPAIMSRLAALGVFENIVPGLGWNDSSAESYKILNDLQQDPTWRTLIDTVALPELHTVLWLQPYPKTIWHAAAERLHLRNLIPQALDALATLLHPISEMNYSTQPSIVDAALVDYAKSPLTLITVRCLFANHPVTSQLDQWQAQWRHLKLTVNGNTLRELGLPSGPVYRDILDHIRAMRLDGELDSAEEHACLTQLVQAHLRA